LERIEATIKRRWSLEEEVGKEESRDYIEGSEDSSREIQKKKTPSSASY